MEENFKLKEIDKKILIELFKNSRQSLNQISKKIGISKQAISNKINKFNNLGLIKSYSISIDYLKFNLIEYNLFIKLKKLDENSYQKIINYLIENKNTTWIGKSFGKYDLKVAIVIKEHLEINNFIFEIFKKFNSYVDLIDSLYIVDKYKSSLNLFLEKLLDIKLDKNKFNITNINNINKDNKNRNNKNNINNRNKNNLTNIKKIDLIDRKILFHISNSQNKTLVDLSNIINLTAEAIKYRLKELEKKEIIKNYSIVINGNKLNKIWCLVLLNINEEKIEIIKNYLKKDENLSSYVQTIGIWNLNVTFFAKNIEELYLNLNNFRTKFSNEIKNFEYLIFFDFYKYPKLPSCILEED